MVTRPVGGRSDKVRRRLVMTLVDLANCHGPESPEVDAFLELYNKDEVFVARAQPILAILRGQAELRD